MTDDRTASRTRPFDSIFMVLVLLATAILCLFLYWQIIYVAGSRYDRFGWHRTPFWPLFPLTFLCASSVFLMEFLPPRFFKAALIVPGLMLSCFALELVAATLQWNELRIMPIIRDVRSPSATSYFNDAEDLVRDSVPVKEFLRTYPQRLAQFHYHAHNKGPMLILFYYMMLRVFPNPDTAALMGALVIGMIGAAAIPATWYMIRSLTGDAKAALYGAAIFTLVPGLHVFLPEFDQVYVPLTALLIALWARALASGRRIYPVLAGLTLSITCLFAFNTLVIGAFLAALTILYVVRGESSLRHVARQAAIVIAAIVLFYGVLYLVTGYDPVATLREAWRHQNINLKDLKRPWPDTIPSDLTNFMIGFGWLPLLVLISFASAFQSHRRHIPLVLMCLAQPVLVAVTGLLQSETTRLWLFMTPLLIVPIGLEIPHWPRVHRFALFFGQTLVLACMTRNLRFH
jgi:hypothetical protein